MAYGPNLLHVQRRDATFVDKVLTGAKSADLPGAQPTTFELIINLKTAKALGSPVQCRCCGAPPASSSDPPTSRAMIGPPC